jgi:hypothetical protein
MIGRDHDARTMFDRLLELRNDLGLLSEEYDTVAGRLVGNFPQAFSHVSLVNTASKLAGEAKPTMEQDVISRTRRGMTRSKTGSGRLHRLAQQSHHKLRRGAGGTPVLPGDETAKTASSPGSVGAAGTSAAKDAGN